MTENTKKILGMIKELLELLGKSVEENTGAEAMSYCEANQRTPVTPVIKTSFVDSRPINTPGTSARNVSTCEAIGGDNKGGNNKLVNVRGQHIEIDYETRQKGSDANQANYLTDLAVVLTVDQLEKLHQLAQKANQQHTPALWLNQAVEIELTASSVFSLLKPASRLTEARTAFDETRETKETEAIKRVLGVFLFGKLQGIAEACELSVPVFFQVILEKIISERTQAAAPVTVANIWNQAKSAAKPSKGQEPSPKPKRVRKPAPKKTSRKAAQKAPAKKKWSHSEAVAQAQLKQLKENAEAKRRKR